METITILLLAIGVSADAFAAAVGLGAGARKLPLSASIRVAFLFGAFQGIMTAAGWFVGSKFEHLISAYDHWAAFGLLTAIGGKMIWDDRYDDGEDDLPDRGFAIRPLFVLAVATSIDALAVGAGLLFLDSIAALALTIGVVTFLLSFAGVVLGHRFRSLTRRHSKTIGGVILIAIGLHILLEHLGVIA